MTRGELQFRLLKAFPSLDLTLLEGWISDEYAMILGELPWQRLNSVGVLRTFAPYSTGTVSLTQGSTAVIGNGTVFTASMDALGFRVPGRNEIYEFSYGGATSGVLDRPYEGPTAATSAYKIFQHIYVMPTDCRMLDENAFAGFTLGPLRRLDRSQLNQADPNRSDFGTPRVWASYMDDSSTPPRLQVELSPIPDAAVGIPFTYSADQSLPGTGAAFLAWIQSSALVEGVTAKIKAHLRDYVGAAYHTGTAKKALDNMLTSEAQGMAPMEMQLPSHYTSHRLRRW